jgi:ABC transport system ATP-binding/permease protein
MTIGSGTEADIRTARGPAEWLRFRYAGGWMAIVRTPGSTLTLDGRPVTPMGSENRITVRLADDAQHRLVVSSGSTQLAVAVAVGADDGSPAPLPPVTAAPRPATTPPPPPSGGESVRLDRRRIVIGRVGSGSDIEIPGEDVAQQHASVRWAGDVAVVRDLGGGTGTYVDGQPVIQAKVPPGHMFVVGHSVFRVGEGGTLHRRQITMPAALEVDGVSVRYPANDTPTMTGIDFSLPRGGLLAIIGPSGVGKSTLFAGLLGDAELDTGSATLDGIPLGTAHPVSPALVSIVPQQDATFPELTVRRTLSYCADIRLASDLDRTIREQRVRAVEDRLGLAGVAHRPAGTLSGGQRRRLNVAMEMLTKPTLLMLDEPTSGLDEGLDRRLMHLLARLGADEGCVVMIVTHSTAHLDVATHVLAIAGHEPPSDDGAPTAGRGGRAEVPRPPSELGYFGPPEQVRHAFGTDSYAQVMDDLRQGVVAGNRAPSARAGRGHKPPAAVAASGRTRVMRRRHALAVGLRRECRRLALRPTVLAGLVLLGPALTALFAVVAAPTGLGGRQGTPNPDLGTCVAVLCICLSFLSMALSLTSVVGDREVIRREARWGVPPSAVVLSRAMSRLLPAVLQAVVAAAVLALLRDGPETPLRLFEGWTGTVVTLCALTVTSMCLGALLSVAASSAEQAVSMMSGSLAVMVILSGLVVPLGSPEGAQAVLSWLSYASPTRWAVSAIAAHIDLAPAGGLRPDGMWGHDHSHFVTAVGVLAVMSVASLAVAVHLLARPRRTRG